MSILKQIQELFRTKGDSLYGGEAVTQQEHALQAALLAEQAQASQAQIIAALLHDVGHLLHELPDDAPDEGVDDRHEILGQCWLEKYFGPEVTEPVRLHVDAKRYLCTVEQNYHDTLSPPSILSLKLQGGPFNESEVQAFESNPYFREAVALRHWDDEAKIVDLPTPDVTHFLLYAQNLVQQ